MTDIQFLVLEFYFEATKSATQKDEFINPALVLVHTHMNPDNFRIEIKDILETIVYLSEKVLIDESEVNKHWCKINSRGTSVYFIEKIDREIKKNDAKLQRQLLRVSISNNRWSPLLAGATTLLAICSVVIAGFAYDAQSKAEKIQPTLQQMHTAQQKQLQELHNLQQSLKNVQVVPRKDSL